MSTTKVQETTAIDDGVDTLKRLVAQLRESASVQSVFGDPYEVGGKTIIPVARIAYGFGGGFGSTDEDDEPSPQGGGGGGGVTAKPVGVLEITADETRFVGLRDRKRLALAALVGMAIGALLSRRQRS